MLRTPVGNKMHNAMIAMHVGDNVLQKRCKRICKLLVQQLVWESEVELSQDWQKNAAGHEFRHKACRSVAMGWPVYIPISAE